MKIKFLRFVRENWSISEYEWADWDIVEDVGTVQFKDGVKAVFGSNPAGEFIQIEE